MTASYPIVGAKFRPPAQGLLNVLPSGAKLLARREAANAYDANAIQVIWLTRDKCFETAEGLSKLDAAVEGFGSSGRDVLDAPEWHLGYIPRTDALTLAPRMDRANVQTLDGQLTFNAAGQPRIMLDETSL